MITKGHISISVSMSLIIKHLITERWRLVNIYWSPVMASSAQRCSDTSPTAMSWHDVAGEEGCGCVCPEASRSQRPSLSAVMWPRVTEQKHCRETYTSLPLMQLQYEPAERGCNIYGAIYFNQSDLLRLTTMFNVSWMNVSCETYTSSLYLFGWIIR